MDERKIIKKKKFLRTHIVDELKEMVGNDTDFASEFETIDVSGKGKVSFEDISHWVLKKNVKIEYNKNQGQ